MYEQCSDDSDENRESARVQHSGCSQRHRLQLVTGSGALAAMVLMCILGARTHHRRVATMMSSSAVMGLNEAGAESAAIAQQVAALASAKNFRNATLRPKEHLHDGNPCGDDEELFGGLCYDKCQLLTGGEYTYRQSPWSCCSQKRCTSNPFMLAKCCVHNMGLCSGYDIAGMSEGNKICPHKPGVCLADEELFLDLCYMKCSVLTNGLYPYRTAAATCCKSSGVGCFIEDGVQDGMDGQAITNATLAVGGGCGDGSWKTACKPHEPDESLTEQ